MSKNTTAMIFAGPKSFGSFGDSDGWRIGLTCQVVDGATSGPFLLCSMPGVPEQIIPWQGLNVEAGVHAVLMALALFYGDGSVQGSLLDTHNIEIESGVARPARFYEFAPEVEKRLFGGLRKLIKVGVINLAPDSSLSQPMVDYLVRHGISVERFSSIPS